MDFYLKKCTDKYEIIFIIFFHINFYYTLFRNKHFILLNITFSITTETINYTFQMFIFKKNMSSD